MKDIIDFCIKHYSELITGVCAIISVVFYIVKKRPSFNEIDAIKEDILEVLPELIKAVEIDGNGQRKKNAVVKAIIDYVYKKYGFTLIDTSFVEKSIENILSTPQKKVKGDIIDED